MTHEPRGKKHKQAPPKKAPTTPSFLERLQQRKQPALYPLPTYGQKTGYLNLKVALAGCGSHQSVYSKERRFNKSAGD